MNRSHEEGVPPGTLNADTCAATPKSAAPERGVAEEPQWLWYYSNCPDDRYYGGTKTREEAIAEGRNEYADGEGFTIIEACAGTFSPPDADTLMCEWLDRWADDDSGADDYPDWRAGPAAVKAAERDLDEIIAAWTARHQDILPIPWAFAGTRNEERIPPLGNSETRTAAEGAPPPDVATAPGGHHES